MVLDDFWTYVFFGRKTKTRKITVHSHHHQHHPPSPVEYLSQEVFLFFEVATGNLWCLYGLMLLLKLQREGRGKDFSSSKLILGSCWKGKFADVFFREFKGPWFKVQVIIRDKNHVIYCMKIFWCVFHCVYNWLFWGGRAYLFIT